MRRRNFRMSRFLRYLHHFFTKLLNSIKLSSRSISTYVSSDLVVRISTGVITMSQNLECPVCGGPMVQRVNSRTGQTFWGCRGFPGCKGTLDGEGRTPEQRRQEYQEDDNRRGRRHSRWNRDE